MNHYDLDMYCLTLKCDDPNCHSKHDTVVFRSGCDPDVPTTYNTDQLNRIYIQKRKRFRLWCPKCGGLTAEFESKDCEIAKIRNECCEYVWASYKLNSGIIVLDCYYCEKEVAKIILE
jgi:hypothetical protein